MDHPTAAAFTSCSMVTRPQPGIVKPKPKYTLAVQKIPSPPKNIKSDLRHPGRFSAMQDEIHALHHNKAWKLLPVQTWMYWTEMGVQA